MPEIPGFHVKYAEVDIEFYSSDPVTVANNYRSVLEWLQKTVDAKLSQMERDIKQLREDAAEIKSMRSEDQYKPDRSLRRERSSLG